MTGNAPWHPRIWFSTVAYKNRMWLLGGWSNNPSQNWNDVWYSADGADWKQLKTDTVWSKRHEHSAYVFDNKIWVVGGNPWPCDNQVWQLDIPDSWLAEDRLYLVRDGQPAVTIVRGQGDDFAGERLARCLADYCGATVPVLSADVAKLPEKQAVILIGSAASNPLLSKLSNQLGLKLDPAELTDQGYVAKRVRHEGRDWVILAGGGRDGAIHAVADLINWRLKHADKDAWLESLDTRQVPRLRYRWLWTWDTRMQWGGPGTPVTWCPPPEGGFPYKKKPEAFLVDYKRCVDYAADHKFNGLIIWGFLRDDHGGVEASKELCEYASRRGVRILPGIGTSGYGGYYYEGKNTFNSDTWMVEHPELRALTKDGKPTHALCPTNKANQDWLDRGAKWLVDTFKVGGVNLEMGDFAVCYCDACRRARAAIPSNEPDYYKDMAISHRVTLKTLRRLAPDSWLSYATYTGYSAAMMTRPPKFLDMIPQDAICQWTLTGMGPRLPAAVRPMAKHNLGYLHWCNIPSKSCDDFYLEEIRNVCRSAAAVGFEGLDTYGELSDQRPNVEIFYLAWEAFLWDPEMTTRQFVEQRLGRLYGGPKAADLLLEIIPLVHSAAQRQSLDNCTKARRLAEQARGIASAEGRGHWDRLIATLSRHQRAAQPRRGEGDGGGCRSGTHKMEHVFPTTTSVSVNSAAAP